MKNNQTIGDKMLLKIRTSLPLIWGGIVALLFVMSAIAFRFSLSTALPGAPNPEDITPFMQTLGQLLSSREMTWALLMIFSIFIKNSLLTAYLFVYRILIELQDIITLTINTIQGRQDAVPVIFIFTIVLIVFHGVAANSLFRRKS